MSQKENVGKAGELAKEDLLVQNSSLAQRPDMIGDIVEAEQEGDTFILPSTLDSIETLWKWLNDKDVGMIAIQGTEGMGKTLIAKHAVRRAVASNLFDKILWLDVATGRHALAKQKRDIATLMENIGEKSFLLILDNIQWGGLEYFEVSNPKGQNKPSKVLLTGPGSKWQFTTHDCRIQLKYLDEDEAALLFGKIIGFEIDSPRLVEFVQPLLKKIEEPLTMSKVLALGESFRWKMDYNLLEKHGELLHLATPLTVLDLLFRIPTSTEVKDCFILACCYRVDHVISVKGLITSWFLGGFIDGYDSLEEAYDKGLEIIKELVNHYLLIEEYNDKMRINCLLEGQNFEFLGSEIGFVSKSFLPILAMNGLEKSTLMSGSSNDIGESFSEASCLLLDENKGCTLPEITDIISKHIQYLQVLGLLHLGIRHLPSIISTLENLAVLVVRGCGALRNVDEIRCKKLENLMALSLSGARSLEEIPDDCFQHMAGLLYLNLSNTRIKKFPSTFSQNCTITTLFLRGCSDLEALPSLEVFKRLAILDLSGASSLTKIPEALPYLKILDISGTLVHKLPSVSNLKSITSLVLRGCSLIRTMPHPDEFPDLEVLDLSGATAFMEFQGETSGTDNSLVKLDLSHTQIVHIPFLSRCVKLQELLLRNCSKLKLETFPCSKLQVLDLSGSLYVRDFHEKNLGVQLLVLDLSMTPIEKLPTIPMKACLTQILLRECRHLEELPHLELQRLEVLDLSGSIQFKKFNNDSFDKLYLLQTLNLSGTQIAKLPSLSECNHLQQLILRRCLNLETLPNLKTLKKLEVLDLCGSIAFKNFEQDSLRKKENLQELNLSGTHVVTVPSLSECYNLRKLVLSGCSMLKELPHLELLSRLEVLDLSFIKFQGQSFGLLETPMVEFPLLSGCINLGQLLLRNCPSLETLPPLDYLTRLELLDLSGTNIVDFSFLSLCTKLSQLSIRGCSNIETLPFPTMHNLQKVDLSETAITMLPSCFLEFENLRQILLKGCSSFTTLPDLNFVNKLEAFDLSCTEVGDLSGGTSLTTHVRFLGLRNGNYCWEFENGNFQRLYFCLFSLTEKLEKKDIHLQRKPFRDIYFETNHILHFAEEPDNFMKICGFQAFPAGIEKVLNHVELLYLKKNDFITRLSDLGAENVKAMRDCWVERCNNMKSVFYGEEEEQNVALGRHLQNLSISNLSEATSLFRRVSQSESFACLKHLYVECCPSLVTVFSLHLELINLETLNIRECHKIESIVGEMVSREKTFPKLIRLTLWKLPMLGSICVGELPSLKLVKVKGCPKLERIPVSVNKTSGRVKIKGEATWWNNLKDEGTKSRMRFTEL